MRHALLLLVTSMLSACGGATSVVPLDPSTPLARGALGPFTASLVLYPREGGSEDDVRALLRAGLEVRRPTEIAEYQVLDATQMGYLCLHRDAAQEADAAAWQSTLGTPTIERFDAPVWIDNDDAESAAPILQIVLSPLPWFRPRNLIEERMVGRVPEYRDLLGLSRKYFVLASGDRVGGVYLWEDASLADAYYDAAWHEGNVARYGAEPELRRFEVLGVDAPTFTVDE
jgi:hypothetical protein